MQNPLEKGVIATLETAEWNMKTLFAEMARHNFSHSDYTAMLRNKFRLKFKSDKLSATLNDYLKANFHLTYDNIFFLINRIEMMDPDLMAMEPEDTKLMLNTFLNS